MSLHDFLINDSLLTICRPQEAYFLNDSVPLVIQQKFKLFMLA